MATYRKRAGSWEAQVSRKGVRKSQTFPTKAEATAWALAIESEIIAEVRGEIPNKTLAQLLERYRDEVSPTKRGCAKEVIRINTIIRDDAIVKVRLPMLTGKDFAEWRDRRLKEVSPASVNRDWNLLSAACTTAVKEWHWLASNPMTTINRPPPTKARTRRISQDEIRRLSLALGYAEDAPPKTISGRVGAAFRFALETGMRAGEIAGLRREDVSTSRRTAHLPMTKNGEARTVPLTRTAVAIIEQMTGDSNTVFDVTTAQIDALFRKAKSAAKIEDLHFHDSRREALSRLAQKLNPFELAKVSGHRELKILLNTYYSATAEDLAAKLD